jgi:phage shock protein C
MKIHNKRLYKSKENKVIAGDMGGLGEYFEIDPVFLRVVYIFVSVFTAIFPGIIAYILMALIMPEKPKIVHEDAEVK